MNKLNQKQIHFANHYIKSQNVAQASKSAGYSYKYGWKLLKCPLMQQLIKEKTAENEVNKNKNPIAKESEILEFLSRLMRSQITNEIHTKDGEIIQEQPGLKERLKAAELLGKGYNLFQASEKPAADIDKVEIKIKVVE